MVEIKSFKNYISEAIIEPSTAKDTISLWHGGNLEYGAQDVEYRKGRHEFGLGLYLVSHHGTAMKYAKGQRKLYLVTIKKGTDIKDVKIPLDDIKKFAEVNLSKAKGKELFLRLEKFIKDGNVDANILSNVFVNENLFNKNNAKPFQKFLIDQGVDYITEKHSFGWGELMVVVVNPKVIISTQKVTSKDTVKEYDLQTEFN